jgi:hypothetical protein
MRSYYGPANVLLLLASVICFLLATFHAPVPVDLVPLGLAFLAIAFLIPRVDATA